MCLLGTFRVPGPAGWRRGSRKKPRRALVAEFRQFRRFTPSGPGRRPDAARGPRHLRAALGEYAAHVDLSRPRLARL